MVLKLVNSRLSLKKTLFVLYLIVPVMLIAQPTGYYNGTEGLSGDALKTALHEIINNHFYNSSSYSNAKYVFLESDADPNISGNVIDVYSGNSMNGLNYGTSAGTLNREHVWAKSHGAFPENSPMYSDNHNLKPCEARINQDRSNLDFDWSSIAHPTATGSFYDSDSWEPRDAVKGDIARIIFYMATRYEGTNGELDLEVADWVGTYPMPKHGKLSSLFAWNLSDPPDDFERNRNNVIYGVQGNRNPFIDNPEWISMIWGTLTPPVFSIGNVQQSPVLPTPSDNVTISCTIDGITNNASVKLVWGFSYTELNNQISLTKNGNNWLGTIPAQSSVSNVYYVIQVTENETTVNSVCYNYSIMDVICIAEIQGTGNTSPYEGQFVQTAGVVTAKLSNGYYIQDSEAIRSGIFVYDGSNKPSIGNYVVLYGKVSEYYNLTEISNISTFSVIQTYSPLPNPVSLNGDEIGEDYESMLVSIEGVCTENANGGYWLIEDETGQIFIHNNNYYTINPTVGLTYSLSGPLSVYNSRWFLELYSYSTNIQESESFSKTVKLYPNPAGNYLNILIPKKTLQSFTLDFFDVSGRIYKTITISNPSDLYNINISSLPSGYWIVRFYNSDYQFFKSFIKK